MLSAKFYLVLIIFSLSFVLGDGGYYHIYWYGMCHFWVPFLGRNRFRMSLLVKLQTDINFGVSFQENSS